MNISPDIKEKAISILDQSVALLPAEIKVGEANPVYFVSEIDDLSVYTHLTIEHDGKIYKIGTRK